MSRFSRVILLAVAAVLLAGAPQALAGPNPKLKDLKVKLKGTEPGPNYEVKVKTRIRACASKGPIRINIHEEKTGFDDPPTVVAANDRRFTRRHDDPCQRFKVSWTLGTEFFGIGIYKVRASVTDSDGNRSRSLVESFKTTD